MTGGADSSVGPSLCMWVSALCHRRPFTARRQLVVLVSASGSSSRSDGRSCAASLARSSARCFLASAPGRRSHTSSRMILPLIFTSLEMDRLWCAVNARLLGKGQLPVSGLARCVLLDRSGREASDALGIDANRDGG